MGMNGPSRARRFQELRAAEDQWKALRKKSDAAAVRYWNIRIEQRYPLRPSPMLGQAVNGGYRYLRVVCTGCKTIAFVPLGEIRRHPSTRLWVLEDALACRRCSVVTPFTPRVRLERMTKHDRDLGWADP
jgi:hypothetical protein